MKKFKETAQFKKDLELCKKRKCKIEKLKIVLKTLGDGKPLPKKYLNHKLNPKSNNQWECHIEPDWLLIYIMDEDRITLVRTGTHSDLF